MRFDKNARIVRSASPVATTVGSEIMLMTLESGEVYGLGETGSDVWRLLEKPTDIQSIVAALGEEYDAPASVIESDVVELLEEMRTRSLIEIAEPQERNV